MFLDVFDIEYGGGGYLIGYQYIVFEGLFSCEIKIYPQMHPQPDVVTLFFNLLKRNVLYCRPIHNAV
jgi:hypothetical protein